MHRDVVAEHPAGGRVGHPRERHRLRGEPLAARRTRAASGGLDRARRRSRPRGSAWYAIATRPVAGVDPDRRKHAFASARDRGRRAPRRAVGRASRRRRRVGRSRLGAVVPGGPDAPGGVDVHRRQRERAEAAARRTTTSTCRRCASGRSKVAPPSVEREAAMANGRVSHRYTTTSSPVGRTTGNTPTAGRAPMSTGADHVTPAVVRRAHREHVVVRRVRVHEVAAPEVGRRRGVVARDPVLVEGDALRRATPRRRRARCSHVAPSGERLTVSRVVAPARASVEMSQVPCARVVRDDRIARPRVRRRRHARDREAGEEAASPRRAVVGRHGVADVRRGAVVAAADLEGRDRRAPEREAVRLDLGLVLRLGVRVRIARETSPDELAVASRPCPRDRR